ncbi:SPP1 family predicted phage head-tail adaptor [Lysinibacillus composti]|uniref:Head-tail adaptor protein n=1 Tax=Lysinibacillus composti TaxID=720633 RepID=A0A3N9UIT7_9BACI|nr:phage head closure protein [Lysinibacillus composti]MBM7607571.1 SPP1 family predicted phage head-tail adaptor [Lysinibacillus composti]RQW75924.1 head-tail adaptor protein [Lysinibacillus composti]
MSIDYRHRIDILENIKTTNELEETIYKFEKTKSIWAAIVPQTGALQRQQADTILTNVTHKIIVRYNAGKDITKDMQIQFRDHKFEIKYILNPYFSNETLEIFVQEVLS